MEPGKDSRFVVESICHRYTFRVAGTPGDFFGKLRITCTEGVIGTFRSSVLTEARRKADFRDGKAAQTAQFIAGELLDRLAIVHGSVEANQHGQTDCGAPRVCCTDIAT